MNIPPKIHLFVLILLTMISIYVTVKIIVYLNPPIKKDFNQITKINMYSMAEVFFDAMEKHECTNITMYVNRMANINNIPYVMDNKLLQQIFQDAMRHPFSHKNYYLLDAWKNPIIITITTNQNGETGIIMHSFGKNQVDENGSGDDILLWFDADTYNNNSLGGAYSKRLRLLINNGLNKPTQKQIDNFFLQTFSIKNSHE